MNYHKPKNYIEHIQNQRSSAPPYHDIGKCVDFYLLTKIPINEFDYMTRMRSYLVIDNYRFHCNGKSSLIYKMNNYRCRSCNTQITHVYPTVKYLTVGYETLFLWYHEIESIHHKDSLRFNIDRRYNGCYCQYCHNQCVRQEIIWKTKTKLKKNIGMYPYDRLLDDVLHEIRARDMFGKSVACSTWSTKNIMRMVQRGDALQCVHCRAIYKECVIMNLGGVWQVSIVLRTRDGEDVLATIDHVIPISKNGNRLLNNMQISCNVCNIVKGNNGIN
jgi:hypothetical protein